MYSIYEDMRRSEREVAQFLKELGLYWFFEAPVFVYDEKERPRVWTPDFYIPSLGMYMEVCGSEKFDYKFREKIYGKNGYDVIFIHSYKEKTKWKNYLIAKIREIEELRHSKVMKVVESFSKRTLI